MADKVLNQAKENMEKATDNLQYQLGQLRAGRANASLLDRVNVTYYGVPTPLNQLASITIPEARVLTIKPFDQTMVQEVEKAILASDVGITPTSDGTVVRLVIPQLTEERRKELAKEVGKDSETAKVSVRNARREAMDEYKKQEKNSDITEDDLRTAEKDIQDLTDKYIQKIDDISSDKENELLEM
ncbi:ribosome recycling factor [Tetragenococcus koreensis]|uniref:Ribosome-recycling factor n=1 Tax=Tetragenococcus koreensis TaxID=290335 RepID=A0AAN4UD98_9ENTE|nr:ribosome recycling factor [Tetragenococcus koreensis]AYW44678.1 ribosome recycling factor [Tetragenococcus koreensis]MCF1584164.1 ribosome recycling factor [Tetragenococcus koreensis]MCF1613703.1 ribosome recycling factor [Tetragenococcus koreensis]MCF1616256.1 ribosome recycling factor [Tetragenococcus koreensis]MCF1618974.1 ribosome recycling factor [Tetragenococcus koreensis]